MNERIKVTIIHTGRVIVDESTIYEPKKKIRFPKLAMLGLFRKKEHKLDIPVSAYLIEHPKGKVLIDTGFHKRVQTQPVKELTLLHYLVNKPVQKPGESVDEKLAAMGIKPADLDYVVLTHMHTDHGGGVRQFTDAKNIIVSKLEYDAATTNKLEYVQKMWKGLNIKTFNFTDSEYGPVNKSYDLFGDGTINLVFVPGHTKGLSAPFIQNNGKSLLLTSDCGYSRKSWEQMILPGVIADREEVISSFEWVKQISEQESNIDCIATHETDLPVMVFEF